MDDLIYKITEEVNETEDKFIFTTINPWCESVMERKISKRDLERALALYFNGDSILDKIRAEIEQAAFEQFRIAMGIADLNERYTHIQMENAYRHSLNVIDKYRESEE